MRLDFVPRMEQKKKRKGHVSTLHMSLAINICGKIDQYETCGSSHDHESRMESALPDMRLPGEYSSFRAPNLTTNWPEGGRTSHWMEKNAQSPRAHCAVLAYCIIIIHTRAT